MNKENLLRMADHIATISQDKFDMRRFRMHDDRLGDHECGSVGCIIGHCIELDKPENVPTFSMYNRRRSINFKDWSSKFTGINAYSGTWFYLFGVEWYNTDNTPMGSSSRIRYFVEHGLPADWRSQMNGEAELSYKN